MFMRQNRFEHSGDLISTNVAEHLAIYDALMQRDARAAALAMRAHITAAARRLGYNLSLDAIELSVLG
jgi:DNA-binding GntR family transcriptional regulator